MASFGSAEEIWRRALDLNLRYYGALGRLSADYVKDFLTVLSDVRSSQPAKPPGPSAVPAPPSPEKRAAVMVLEEDVHKVALGVFLVENNLDHEVSARPVASVFVDTNGRQVRPAVKFDPEVVTLRSGEQLLVRVMANIDETLEPDVRYQGEVTIPELTGTRIPIVVRRRAASDASPAEAPSDAPSTASSTERRKPLRPVKQRRSPPAQRRP